MHGSKAFVLARAAHALSYHLEAAEKFAKRSGGGLGRRALMDERDEVHENVRVQRLAGRSWFGLSRLCLLLRRCRFRRHRGV